MIMVIASSDLSVLQQLSLVTGFVTGVAGLTLGIVNLWLRIAETRPKLRIRPRLWSVVGEKDDGTRNVIERDACVLEVANVGRVPVRAGTICIRYKGTKVGAMLPFSDALDQRPWPAEIEPGEVRHIRMGTRESVMEWIVQKDTARVVLQSLVGDMFEASKKDMASFREQLAQREDPA
jgi:hypothetical protein